MSNETPQYKPGDIANGHYLGDDNQWHPVVGAPAVVKAERSPRRWFTKKRFVIPAAVVAVLILAVALTPKKSTDVADADTTITAPTATAKATSTPVEVDVPDVAGQAATDATTALQAAGFTVRPGDDPTAAVTATTPGAGTSLPKGATMTLVQDKPKLTLGQQNAVATAQSYLKNLAFSRAGLIEQLSSEYGSGFSVEDATFAVDFLNPDWNAQAAKAAQSYIDTLHLSRDGLFEQLTSEYGAQFTTDQANAGLAAVGY